MLKVKLMPQILTICGKIDVQPIKEAIGDFNFKAAATSDEAKTELAARKTEMGVNVIAAIVPQLGKFSDDIVKFIADYEGISETEAGELDFIAELKKILNDSGITTFFTSSLRTKATARK